MKKIIAILLSVIIVTSAIISVFAYNSLGFGDVDQDGRLTSNDACLVLMHSVNLRPISSTYLLHIADVNGDEELNSSDALLILQNVVELIEHLPMDEKISEIIREILGDVALDFDENRLIDDIIYE